MSNVIRICTKKKFRIRANTSFFLDFHLKMDLNPTKTSYFCEDQIDELNNTYLEFCSQYEQSSQQVLTQPLLDVYQDRETDVELTEQTKQLNFQDAFIQLAKLSAEKLSESFNSQTNFEAQTHVVLTQNPHLANTENKPSIETFLECNQYFETLRASPKKAPKETKGSSEEIRFNSGPQVLMITDILKINIDPMNSGPLGSEQMLYGQKFRSVMFYGRCQLDETKYTKNDGNYAQSEHIKRKYIVDDGSDKIVIHTSQTTNSNRQGLEHYINNLKCDFENAQKHNILLENDSEIDIPTYEKMMECGKSILGAIDRNMAEKKNELVSGAKVCVIGVPFRNSQNNNIEIFVYNVHEDSGPDRQMELSFMNHVLHEYETKLFKFKITGEQI